MESNNKIKQKMYERILDEIHPKQKELDFLMNWFENHEILIINQGQDLTIETNRNDVKIQLTNGNWEFIPKTPNILLEAGFQGEYPEELLEEIPLLNNNLIKVEELNEVLIVLNRKLSVFEKDEEDIGYLKRINQALNNNSLEDFSEETVLFFNSKYESYINKVKEVSKKIIDHEVVAKMGNIELTNMVRTYDTNKLHDFEKISNYIKELVNSKNSFLKECRKYSDDLFEIEFENVMLEIYRNKEEELTYSTVLKKLSQKKYNVQEEILKNFYILWFDNNDIKNPIFIDSSILLPKK